MDDVHEEITDVINVDYEKNAVGTNLDAVDAKRAIQDKTSIKNLITKY